MKDTEFYKLAELYGFAPSRALRELVEAVYKKAFHDANINAAATILDAAVLEEREACAKVCDTLAAQDKLSNYYAVAARAIRARGNT